MSVNDLPITDRRPLDQESASDGGPAGRDLELDQPGEWPEEMDVSFYADTSLTIPGQSAPPGDCGEWKPMNFCTSCGEVHIGQRRCQRRLCRECWLTWRGDRAASVTHRLAGARRAADGANKRLSHVVASPPAGEVRTLTQWERAKREAYSLAKEKGIDGGVMIPHGWRVREEAKALYREMKEAGLVDGGIWQWVRESDRDWRNLTYWSPHFHILGLGADLGASDPESDGGWIFSRVDSFERFDLKNEKTYLPMLKASSYLLSHGAFEVESGKQMIRWFGSLANNQFVADEQLADWEQSVIARNVQAVAGRDLDEESSEEDERRTCDRDGCDGSLAVIYDAGTRLCDPEWCDRIDREREHRLAAAFEWVIGEVHPPPGLKRPQTEKAAEEALETLV